MAAMTELRTPPATQANVVALWSQGTPKRQIARELGIDKNTVSAILRAYSQDNPQSVDKIQQLTPKAYDAVDKALTRGDAKIGMDWLKCTVFSQQSGDKYTIHADQVLMSGLDLMPKPVAAQPVLDCTPSVMPATGTEAPANPSPSSTSLSSHTNFSQILASASTDDLIAELKRRGIEVLGAAPDALGIKG